VRPRSQEPLPAFGQVIKHGSFHTGLEPLLAKVAGVLKPLALGAGAGALGLAAIANHTAAQDDKARRKSLVYTPVTGTP
jgi:hypothetical protein